MAYHVKSIWVFLTDQGATSATIEEAMGRAAKAAKKFSDGETFSGGALGEVLGTQELVQAFQAEWECNSALRSAGFD